MSRLLITTFQQPGYNIREVMRFKRAALDSKLLTVDRGDEVIDILPPLIQDRPKDKQKGLRWHGKKGKDGVLLFLDLSDFSGVVWKRLTADNNIGAFTAWLESYFSKSVDCLVLGGHHADNAYSDAIVYGTYFNRGQLLPWAGAGVRNGALSFVGYSKGGEKRIAVATAAAALKGCSLLLILGCNGVPTGVDGGIAGVEMPAAWRKLTKAADGKGPLVLGWFGTHYMVKDEFPATISEPFWTALKQIKTANGIADGDLRAVCRNHARAVVDAWGRACHDAFIKDKVQKHLWYLDGEGCGAITPDGEVYNANPTYKPGQGQPIMRKVGDMPA